MDTETSHAAIQSQVLQTTLAEITTSRGPESATTPAECCVICLEELSEPGAAQPCGHANFDFICLTNWLAVDPKCPLCKAPVLRVRYTDSAGAPQTYTVPDAPKPPSVNTSSSSPGLRSSQSTFQHYFLNQRSRAHHHRRRNPTPTTTTPSPSAALLRRRHIYAHNLYSLHVGSNPLSRYRSGPTPADFVSDASLVSRARTFIRRELQVFSFLSSSSSLDSSSPTNTERRANNAEFLLEYTIAILKTVDMQGAAGQAESMLADFLGRESARLFLHELRAWLRSPCLSLETWDRGVQYPDPEPDAGAAGGLLGKRRREEGADAVEMEVDKESGRRRDGRTGEVRRKGDYWRPSHRRYDEGRRRRRQGGEKVEVRS